MVPPSSRDFAAAAGRLLEGQERLELWGSFGEPAGARVERADGAGVGTTRTKKVLDRHAELVPELARVAAVDDLGPQLARGLVVGLGVLAEGVEEHARERVPAAG